MTVKTLFPGCECPQKSMYAAILLYALCLPLGGIFGKKNTSKLALTMFVAMLVLGSIWYLLIQWCCNKKYNTAAWVLIALPYIAAIYKGYSLSNMNKLESALETLSSSKYNIKL